MIIDAHHHFWNYDPVEYAWIGDHRKKIQRSFLPDNLKNEIEGTDVVGVISVQARQAVTETDWLLKLAKENDFILCVIGWLPLADLGLSHFLEFYGSSNKLCALRHVIEDEPDPEFMLRKNFNEGITLLKHYRLAFDILIYDYQLPNTILFVDKHPEQIFILDHIAKPKIKRNEMSPWKENIRELAKRENVYCKISGMTTEANLYNWNIDQLLPYFEVVYDAFGPDRIMFGSDWPVCLTAVSYKEWIKVVKEFISKISIHEQIKILYKNSITAYNL